MGSIFDGFGGKYITLEKDEQAKVVLTKPTLIESPFKDEDTGEKKKMIRFSVVELNGEACDKEFSTGNGAIIGRLRGYFEEQGLDAKVSCVLSKDATKYSVVVL